MWRFNKGKPHQNRSQETRRGSWKPHSVSYRPQERSSTGKNHKVRCRLKGVRRSCLAPLKPSGLPCWYVCPRPGKRHRWDKWDPVFFFLSQKECMGPLEVGGCPDYHHFASCPVWEGSEGLESLLGVPVCCPRPSLHAALHPRMQMNSDPSWFQLSDTVILVWLSVSHVSVVDLKSKSYWGIWIFIWQPLYPLGLCGRLTHRTMLYAWPWHPRFPAVTL